MAENQLLQELRAFAQLTKDTMQGDFFQAKLDAAKEVKVVPCKDVLTDEQINMIKRVIRPRKKECYKNATKLALRLDNCKYCEGSMLFMIGIDHAFNKVGDKYIDITKEFALGEDPSETKYITIGEYDRATIREAMSDTGVYGEVFNWLYRKCKR